MHGLIESNHARGFGSTESVAFAVRRKRRPSSATEPRSMNVRLECFEPRKRSSPFSNLTVRDIIGPYALGVRVELRRARRLAGLL